MKPAPNKRSWLSVLMHKMSFYPEFYFLVLLAVVVCVVPLFTPPSPYDPGKVTPLLTSQVEPTNKLFDYRLKEYAREIDQLNTNIQLQGVCAVLFILLLISRSGRKPLPILGMEVPVVWLHFLLPAFMLYLWLQFGFLFDDAIKNRMNAFFLLTCLGEQPGDPTASRYWLFSDHGIIDSYFIAFLHQSTGFRKSLPPSNPTSWAPISIYGLLLSSTHAGILSLPLIARHRFFPDGGPRPACTMLFWVSLLAILGSHTLFAYGGNNPNWLSLLIACVCVPLCILLTTVSSPHTT